MEKLRIAVDAFGGDNSPDSVLSGAVLAAASVPDLEIILTGDEKVITKRMLELGLNRQNITVTNADGVIEIEDNPLEIRTAKKNSSMGTALSLAASGEADAVVSAGSTAALVVGATVIIGRIKGIKRPAIASIMPSISGNYLLCDCGANSECRPEMLLQFAEMGSMYAQLVTGIDNPRVGLLNIGAEREKGRDLERAAHELLASSKLNFIGNAEGRDAILGRCDVLISDGFTGNVYLKTVEGMGKFMESALKDIFTTSFATKLAYLVARPGVKAIRGRMDYREVGGSPLLGVAKPVIKAHGSSDARAVHNAIKQAARFCRADVNGKISAKIDEAKSERTTETQQ